jgi:hypothetical protein
MTLLPIALGLLAAVIGALGLLVLDDGFPESLLGSAFHLVASMFAFLFLLGGIIVTIVGAVALGASLLGGAA